jgi:hypothetical protein
MEEDRQSHSPLAGGCIRLLTLYSSLFYSPIALSPEDSKIWAAPSKCLSLQRCWLTYDSDSGECGGQ